MSKIIELPLFSDERGKLVVIEKVLGFDIKRIYFIYDIKGLRGGHRHLKTKQALLCIKGKCKVYIENPDGKLNIILDSPTKCILLEPEDWHTIESMEKDTVILVIASEYYDKSDYITERY
ncbi:MAG: FdtA/QdtA family cupin domain-containing protein, partial [Candidatus Calescibacterium sp.]|nr:FdtA/QdtA family cupin domain-containing protein [Candidatus Calescibacterium sp.]